MSLPVAKSTTPPMFAVTGKSLQLQLPRPIPQLPTRKIYNPTYFFNETYQHEIANHYRDYKRRARIPRRRRHTIYVPYRRAAFYGVVSGEPRAVLPMAIHDFPRFTAVYTTPRGRQTLCENAPPDDTYNASVRRIRQADSYKELKLLVDKQLGWRSAQRKRGVTNYCNGRVDTRQRQHASGEGEGFCSRKAFKCATTGKGKDEKPTKRQINCGADVNADATNANGNLYYYHVEYVDDDAYDSDANDSVEKVKANVLQVSRSKQEDNKQNLYKKQPTRTAGQINATPNQHSAPALTKVSTFAHKVRPHTVNYSHSKQPFSVTTDAVSSATESYLRLACEYYEQGVLRHINYLQAIGKRNTARRVHSKRATASQTTRSSSNEETATRDSSATNTPLGTPRVHSAAHCFRLTNLLRRIARKRSFRVGCSVATQLHNISANVEQRLQHNPCAIRVNIKPFVGRAVKALKATRQHSVAAPITAAAYTTRTLDGCSMNDYLNANSSNTISTTATTVAARAHFHELIDHLMQLEISDIDASLPKITLTDCSTIANNAPFEVAHTDSNTTAISHTNDNAFAFQFDNVYNSNNFSAYNAFDSQVAEQKQQQQQQQLEQQLPISARRNGFTLRQTKFGTSYSSLDIPDEVYYNSEARPP